MKHVAMYTTPTCQYCHMAKDFFAANDITVEEYDVAADEEKRNAMVEKSGQMGVPVIDIEGTIIIGFDEPKIKELLGMEA